MRAVQFIDREASTSISLQPNPPYVGVARPSRPKTSKASTLAPGTLATGEDLSDLLPAIWVYPVPEIPRICSILRFLEKFSSNFPGTFPEVSSRTPEQIPETATAFLSFLIKSARAQGQQQPPSPGASDSPFPSPEQEKIKNI